MVKVAAVAVVVAFVIFYIMSSPEHAAHIASGGWHWVSTAAHDIGHFVDDLSK